MANRFKCKICGGNMKVINSRNRTSKVRLRRYECEDCEDRITTAEIHVMGSLHGGRPFDDARAAIVRAALPMATPHELMVEIEGRMT